MNILIAIFKSFTTQTIDSSNNFTFDNEFDNFVRVTDSFQMNLSTLSFLDVIEVSESHQKNVTDGEQFSDESDKDEDDREEIRRETFYKLTNSADVPEAPSEGGRNLAQGTSKDWSKPFTGFPGRENICPSLYKVLTDGLVVGDTLKTRIVLKYTDIVPTSGKTAIIRLQGSGDVSGWGWGYYNFSPWKTISGSGEVVFEHEFKINDEHLKNSYWGLSFRTDWIASGSLQWKLAKVEKGTLFTDWSPAPEDLGWSTNELAPTQSQRYLWKFDYIYYSDDSVEVASPVNLSITGNDGKDVKDREPFSGDDVKVGDGLTLTITDGDSEPLIKKYK